MRRRLIKWPGRKKIKNTDVLTFLTLNLTTVTALHCQNNLIMPLLLSMFILFKMTSSYHMPPQISKFPLLSSMTLDYITKYLTEEVRFIRQAYFIILLKISYLYLVECPSFFSSAPNKPQT